MHRLVLRIKIDPVPYVPEVQSRVVPVGDLPLHVDFGVADPDVPAVRPDPVGVFAPQPFELLLGDAVPRPAVARDIHARPSGAVQVLGRVGIVAPSAGHGLVLVDDRQRPLGRPEGGFHDEHELSLPEYLPPRTKRPVALVGPSRLQPLLGFDPADGGGFEGLFGVENGRNPFLLGKGAGEQLPFVESAEVFPLGIVLFPGHQEKVPVPLLDVEDEHFDLLRDTDVKELSFPVLPDVDREGLGVAPGGLRDLYSGPGSHLAELPFHYGCVHKHPFPMLKFGSSGRG